MTLSSPSFCLYKRPDIALLDLGQACNDYDESGASDDFQYDFVWKRKLHKSSDFDINELINTSKLRNPKPYPCNKTPCLNIACKYGSVEMVAFILSLKADPSTTDEVGNTALHAVCETQIEQAQKLALLLDIDPDYFRNEPNVQPINGALQFIAKQGQVEPVAVLLQSGADPNTTAHEWAPLGSASLEGHLDVVKFLLEHGAKVNMKCNGLMTALHVACYSGQTSVTQALIQSGAHIDASGERNTTPLHIASQNGHSDVVKILIQNRAHIDARDEIGLTPLHIASQNGHSDVVKILKDNGAYTDACDARNLTPLHLASQTGHTDVVKKLTQYGAHIDAQTAGNGTPLHHASHIGHIGVVKILIQNHANVNAQAAENATPLHLASQNGHSDVIKVLIAGGANIKAQAKKNATPLHIASNIGHSDVVKILIQSGADIDARGEDNSTPLHLASQDGHIDVVKILIQNGANIDAQTEENFTPLHLAILNDHIGVAKTLIQSGAHTEAQGVKNATPLHIASQHGHMIDIVKMLIRCGAHVNSREERNYTPLHIASQNGHIDVVKKLIESGAHVVAREEENWTPLHKASKHGHIDVVKILLESGAEINAQTEENWTPLHLASQNGHIDVVNVLIQSGAQIDAQTKEGTPLHYASQHGHSDVVKILIQSGANINALTENNATPLQIASLEAHIDVVNILIRSGADVDVRGGDKLTALYAACAEGHVDVLRLLHDHGESIEARHQSGATPLIIASIYGNTSVVQELLHRGADVNASQEWDITPLHNAVEFGQNDTVEVLLNHGANIHAEDKHGRTPLHFSSEFANENITRTLLSKGANPNSQNRDGNTPVHIAAARGHVEILKALISSNICDLGIKNRQGCDALQMTQAAGQTDAADVLLSYLNPKSGLKVDAERKGKTQKRSHRCHAVTNNDLELQVGRVVNTADGRRRPVTYNVSTFLRYLRTSPVNLGNLEKYVDELDKAVTVEKCYKHHNKLCEGIRGIVGNICREISQADERFKHVKPVETGSLFAGLKVGLPYEADFLLEVKCNKKHWSVFREFRNCISNMSCKKMLANTENWFLRSVDQNRVGMTLTLEHNIHEGEIIGFGVDLVPFFKDETVQQKVKFKDEAQKYMMSKGLLYTSHEDIVTLLSPHRDYEYDTGILVSKIMCNLTEEQKRGFRIAKYIIQNGIISKFTSGGDLEKSQKSLELHGQSLLIRSFHLRLCFLHLLVGSCGKMLPRLGGAKLALCLLDMLKNIFLQFGTRDMTVDKTCFLDPLIENDSLKYDHKLSMTTSAYANLAKDIETVTNTFLADVSSGDLSRYTLLNYPGNREKNGVVKQAQDCVVQLLQAI